MLKLTVLLIFMGCSGYRFSQQENPLSQYGIDSLSVPMFYNYSNISEIHADITRDTYRLLSSFPGLKLRSGYDEKSDAVLFGIVKSPEKIAETIRPLGPRVAGVVAKKSVGEIRQNFNVPGTSDVQLYLQIIVIKRPTEEELTLLKSGIGDQVKSSSRVIFNELIPLRIGYNREILDDLGTQVNATQNAGVQRKVMRSLSEQAALNIRDLIFYAF